MMAQKTQYTAKKPDPNGFIDYNDSDNLLDLFHKAQTLGLLAPEEIHELRSC